MTDNTNTPSPLAGLADYLRAAAASADAQNAATLRAWACAVEDVSAAPVPPGYALVPVEPTREMLAAASLADDKAFIDGSHHGASRDDIWYAMVDAALAAAPAAAPVPEQEPAAYLCCGNLYRSRDEIPMKLLPPVGTITPLYTAPGAAAPQEPAASERDALKVALTKAEEGRDNLLRQLQQQDAKLRPLLLRHGFDPEHHDAFMLIEHLEKRACDDALKVAREALTAALPFVELPEHYWTRQDITNAIAVVDAAMKGEA